MLINMILLSFPRLRQFLSLFAVTTRHGVAFVEELNCCGISRVIVKLNGFQVLNTYRININKLVFRVNIVVWSNVIISHNWAWALNRSNRLNISGWWLDRIATMHGRHVERCIVVLSNVHDKRSSIGHTLREIRMWRRRRLRCVCDCETFGCDSVELLSLTYLALYLSKERTYLPETE